MQSSTAREVYTGPASYSDSAGSHGARVIRSHRLGTQAKGARIKAQGARAGQGSLRREPLRSEQLAERGWGQGDVAAWGTILTDGLFRHRLDAPSEVA